MKTTLRLATYLLLTFAIARPGFSIAPQNLVAGVGPITNIANWSGYSAMSAISGPAVFPVTSSTTVLYMAFTQGSQADIGNMVLYQTSARDPQIAAVIAVTLNGVSNPSINLTDPAVCPVQPVSAASPCIVRLDPIALQLSAASDYYFVSYFSADSNNQQLGLSQPHFLTSSLTGGFIGIDTTHLTVGQSVSPGNSGTPYGLIAVMSN
ncbi:MAG: hypothetical protein HY010_06345 [Acidobacteria bacterium]|nr:hypothetical protein [Acidobacteriota bacterium]